MWFLWSLWSKIGCTAIWRLHGHFLSNYFQFFRFGSFSIPNSWQEDKHPISNIFDCSSILTVGQTDIAQNFKAVENISMCYTRSDQLSTKVVFFEDLNELSSNRSNKISVGWYDLPSHWVAQICSFDEGAVLFGQIIRFSSNFCPAIDKDMTLCLILS